MERIVAIDLSRAYLLARYSYEARMVLRDDWLSEARRVKAAAIYIEIGQDFNDFFLGLRSIPISLWYKASVHALETFRNNLDILWMYAYSGNMRKIIWLSK